MRDWKMENLFRKIRNFSRKDLQGLCKKYGLPANTSNPEMATSLILYLKKNLSIRAIWEGTRGDQKKGCGLIAYRSGSGNNQCHNDLQNCKDFTISDKASIDVGSFTQLHRESISFSGVSSHVVAPSPSFTFDVHCEDGIPLYVDLNSSSEDWIESLKSGVHINHDVHKHMLQSFDEDKGLLCCPYQRNGFITINPSLETDDGQLQDGSFPTTILTDNLAQSDEADEVKGPMPSSGLKYLSSVIHGNGKDEKGYLFSRFNSGSQGQLSGAKSRRREKIVAADSDLNAVQTKTRNCVGNSIPSDLKCSIKSAHHGANAGNGICKKPPLQLTDSSMDPILERSELSTTISIEMKATNCATMILDSECSPSGIHSCVNVVDRLKNNEVVQSGIVKSVQNPSRDELQMRPAPTVHQSICVSPLLKGLPLDLADDKRNVETEHRRTSFFSDSDRQIKEVQPHSAGSYSKSSCSSFCHRHVFQDVINLTNGIETKNSGFLRTQETGSETDELRQKDAALYPCRNDGSLELVFPKNNGIDHQISPKSNEFQEEICRIPSKRRRSSRLFTKVYLHSLLFFPYLQSF